VPVGVAPRSSVPPAGCGALRRLALRTRSSGLGMSDSPTRALTRYISCRPMIEWSWNVLPAEWFGAGDGGRTAGGIVHPDGFTLYHVMFFEPPSSYIGLGICSLPLLFAPAYVLSCA